MIRPFRGGLLVAIEGIDGAGKTTLATLLAQWCGERGIGCVLSKEPTGIGYGEELRRSAREGRLTLERELELFRLDREAHVARTIAPALAEGNAVLLDRYYWSTAAYQGARGASVPGILRSNEAIAPKPDLFLVLQLPVRTGLERIGARGDATNAFEQQEGLEKAATIFESLAVREPHARLLAGTQPVRQVFAEALTAFQEAARRKLAAAAPGAIGQFFLPKNDPAIPTGEREG